MSCTKIGFGERILNYAQPWQEDSHRTKLQVFQDLAMAASGKAVTKRHICHSDTMKTTRR